jgi:hypothetical protein
MTLFSHTPDFPYQCDRCTPPDIVRALVKDVPFGPSLALLHGEYERSGMPHNEYEPLFGLRWAAGSL